MLSLFLFLVNVYIFFRSKNIFLLLIVAVNLFYFVEVVYVQQIFGSPFSNKSNLIGWSFLLELALVHTFLASFLFFTTSRKIGIPRFIKADKIRLLDIFLFFIILSFSFYLILSRGDALLNYKAYVGLRSPVEDYLIFILIFFTAVFRPSKLVIFSWVILALVFAAIGERYRFLSCAIVVFLYFREFNSMSFKILFVPAYMFSVLIDVLRTIVIPAGFHISHFGAVTVSTFMISEYVESSSSLDNVAYFGDMLLGSLIPSSFLNEEFSLRYVGSNSLNVPGGGYYVYLSYVLVGVFGPLLYGTFISFLCAVSSLVERKRLNHLFSFFPVILFLSLGKFIMYSPYMIFRFTVPFLVTSLLLTLIFLPRIPSDTQRFARPTSS